MGEVVFLSDRLAKLVPGAKAPSAAPGKAGVPNDRIVVSSAHPRAIEIMRQARQTGSLKVLLLIESEPGPLSPATMESLARVHGIRTLSIDEEADWQAIVARWLRDPAVDGRNAAGAPVPRRLAGARKSSRRAA